MHELTYEIIANVPKRVNKFLSGPQTRIGDYFVVPPLRSLSDFLLAGLVVSCSQLPMQF